MPDINWFDDEFVKKLVFDLLLENHLLRSDLDTATKNKDYWRDEYFKLKSSVDAE